MMLREYIMNSRPPRYVYLVNCTIEYQLFLDTIYIMSNKDLLKFILLRTMNDKVDRIYTAVITLTKYQGNCI